MRKILKTLALLLILLSMQLETMAFVQPRKISCADAGQVAFQGCLAIAKQGNANAQFWTGVHYWNGDGTSTDRAQAIYWFEKSAEQGEQDAQSQLGKMYFLGNDFIKQNYAKGFYWSQKAAEQGNKEGQKYLADAYLHGKGAPIDNVKAFELYRKSAEQGFLWH
jgi:uncharacterized protein